MTSNQLLRGEKCDFEYSVNKNFELTKAQAIKKLNL